MFKILTENWRYFNGNIMATVSLLVNESVVFFARDFSVSQSITQLADTLNLNGAGKKLNFFCFCGNPQCANYFSADINKANEENFLFKTKTYSGKNLKVNILKNNYLKEINILLQDFAEFENNLKTIDSNYTLISEKLSINNTVIINDVDKNNLEKLINDVNLKQAIFLLQKYNWKIQDVLPLLFAKEESIRFAATYLIKAFPDTAKLNLDKIIPKISDEFLAVRYASLQLLSNLGLLKKEIFFKDLFHLRKVKNCSKQAQHNLSIYDHPEKIYLQLLEEQNLNIANLALSQLVELSKKNQDIFYEFYRMLNKGNLLLEIQGKLLEIISQEKTPLKNKIFTSYLENNSNNIDIRKKVLNYFKDINLIPDVSIVLTNVANDTAEDEEIIKQCKQILEGKSNLFTTTNLIYTGVVLLALIALGMLVGKR